MKLPENYVLGVGVVKPTGRGGFGQKMLERMGWKDGEGLGKHKTGIKEAIELRKKDNKDGVGRKTAFDWKVPFWEKAFETGLKNVGKVGPEPSGPGQENGGPSSPSSSSDSASGSGDASPGSAPSKKRKLTFNMDGTVATGQTSELDMLSFLSKGRAGRWGGREAKLARIRQQEASLANEARRKLGLEEVPAKPPSHGKLVEDGTTHPTKSKRKEPKKQKRKKRDGADECGNDRQNQASLEVGEGTAGKEMGTPEGSGMTSAAVAGKSGKKRKGKDCGGRGSGKENDNVDSGARTRKKAGKEKKRRARKEVADVERVDLEGSCLGEPPTKKKRRTSSKTHLVDQEGEVLPSSGPEKRKKGKKNKNQASRKSNRSGSDVVHEVKVAEKVDLPDRTPTSGWWGAKRFVSAGFAGEVKEVIPTDWLERQAFDEDDQVKVYMFAHNAKRKGFGGLGCPGGN